MLQADLAAHIEHGRWLLEYHNRRSDGITQRAAALLGFTGIVLALAPTVLGLLPDAVDVPASIWVNLAAALGCLSTAAVLLLLTVSTKRTGGPGIGHARDMLRNSLSGKRVGRAMADIAESLLHTSVATTSPVELACAEADQRVKTFKFALWALLAGFGLQAALVIQIALML